MPVDTGYIYGYATTTVQSGYNYRIFRCISRDFKTEKFAPKIDLDLYTDDNFKVSKIGADFLICCSNLQIIYP